MSSSSSSSSNSNQKLKVVVIGGGISGIATGIRLSEALGDRLDLTVSLTSTSAAGPRYSLLTQIIEKKGSPGGVWRDSKWPGAGVDVPIHLYSLYSDLNPEWDTVFASQPEVLAYWEKLVDKHGEYGERKSTTSPTADSLQSSATPSCSTTSSPRRPGTRPARPTRSPSRARSQARRSTSRPTSSCRPLDRSLCP